MLHWIKSPSLLCSPYPPKEIFYGSPQYKIDKRYLLCKIDKVVKIWVEVLRFPLLSYYSPTRALRYHHKPLWLCGLRSESTGLGQRPGLPLSFSPTLWKFLGTLPASTHLLSDYALCQSPKTWGSPPCHYSHETRTHCQPHYEWTNYSELWCSFKLPVSIPCPASLDCKVDCCYLLSLIQSSSLDST